MAYTLDSSTSEGQVRILVGDTDSTSYVFEDDYLTNLLDLNSDDIWATAADCCRSLAAKYAKEAFVLGLGKQDIWLDRKKKSDYYIQLSKSFDVKSGGDVVEFFDSYNYNISGTGVDKSEYLGDES
jgi:hypothetical protein